MTEQNREWEIFAEIFEKTQAYHAQKSQAATDKLIEERAAKLDSQKVNKKCSQYYDSRAIHKAQFIEGNWHCVHCGEDLNVEEFTLASLFG